MKVTAERIPEAQVVLEIEIDDERVQQSLHDASRRLALRYRIPGFRKGRAPRAVVERTLGADVVFDEAVERLVPEAYEEALRQQSLAPIGPPGFEILERRPVRFKATVPLEPTIDLGDYRSIITHKEPVVVTDEMIDDTILELRRQHAVLEPVERPAGYNDRLRLDIRAEVEGRSVLRQEGVELSLREGMTLGVPGVAAKICGLAKGSEHEFRVEVPADWHDKDVAGETVTFFVTIHDIKQEIVPESDDDLAAEVADLSSFQELRDRVATDLRAAAERRATEAHQQALLDALGAKATVEYPPILIDHELQHLLGELARQAGQSLEEYLQGQGENAAALRESLRAQAEERVRRGLLLDELATQEGISVSDSEIEGEITRLAGPGPQAPQVRAVFDAEDGRTLIRRNLRVSKTLERLAAIAQADPDEVAAAPQAETEAAAPPPSAAAQ